MLDNVRVMFSNMIRDQSDVDAYKLSRRSKRELFEAYGSFLHRVFGFMDAETAREYYNLIMLSRNDSSRFHDMLQDQTT